MEFPTLAPFCKSRTEVSVIRSDLQSHLSQQVCGEGEALSAINLAQPTTTALDHPPKSLRGVRRAYWKALQAHNAAQAKLDALKAEIAAITGSGRSMPAEPQRASGDSTAQAYIALSRQRQRQRKLRVVERAVSDMTTGEHDPTAFSLDDVVKQRVGELPVPPLTQTPASDSGPDPDALILELKKAVLRANNELAEAQPQTRNDIGNQGPPQTELRALRAAHAELTSWIEEQLAKISEQAPEPEPERQSHGVGDQNGHNSSHSDNDGIIAKVHGLYDKYLAARRAFVHTVKTPVSLGQDAPASAEDTTSRYDVADGGEERVSPAITVLPYIPSLVTMAQQERALLQQSSYMRRQISSAEGETQRLVARLAGESHLVHPGAYRARDWTSAGNEAGTETKRFVEQCLKVGEASAADAEKILADVKAVPRVFDRLRIMKAA